MRLLIFAHDASLYGASQSLLTLIANFKQNQVEEMFVILPHKGGMEEKLTKMGVNYQVILFPRCFSRIKITSTIVRFKHVYLYNRHLKKVLPDLADIITQFNPDIIYSNTSIVSIGAFISKTYKLPHVWHIREIADEFYNFEYLPSRKKLIEQMRENSKLIFVSKSLRDHWLGKDQKDSYVIYNGILSIKDQKKNLVNTSFTFGILGTILPGKCQHLAIEALHLVIKKHPNVMLSIYGNIIDKSYYQQLLNLVTEYRLNANIVFHGFEDDSDIIYDKLDVLLNCSLFEGFGRTIIEAMSKGIPTIANASGGPLEIIRHNENGLLFNNTPENLAESMQILIEDRVSYELISKNGKADALQLYSVQKYVNSVYDVLKSSLT